MTAPQTVQIQLTIEEGLEFQRFDAELTGYLSGVQATLDFVKRRKIDQILSARKPPAPPAPSPAEPAAPTEVPPG